MNHNTAVKIVDRMLSGEVVKLRSNKWGNMISVKTWNGICDALFWLGFTNVSCELEGGNFVIRAGGRPNNGRLQLIGKSILINR